MDQCQLDVHTSCFTGNIKLLIKGIENGADLNFDHTSYNPFEPLPFGKSTLLMIACCNGNDEIVRLLIQHGAEPNQYTTMNCYPLQLAYHKCNIETIILLTNLASDNVLKNIL